MDLFRLFLKRCQAFISEHLAYLGFLLLAIFIWFLIKMSDTFELTEQFEIEYRLDDNYIFDQSPPHQVNMLMRAKGWDFFNLYIGEFQKKLFIDTKPEQGSQTLSRTTLTRAIQRQLSDSRINILQLSPDHIALSFAKKAQKYIPVSLQGTLECSEAHILLNPIRVLPDSVLIRGDLARIEQIDQWATESFSYTDVKASFEDSLQLVPATDGLDILPHTVLLKVEIEQKTNKKIIVDISNALDSILVIPSEIEISFEVGLSRYQDIEPEDFKLEIQIDSNRSQKVLIAPILLTDQPAWIENIRFTPKAVEYIYKSAIDH